MNRLCTFLCCVLFFSLLMPRHVPAEARQIRWNQIIGADANRLSAEQRARAAALMRSEFCYFGCSRTIARCLEASQPSRTARRLGGYIVRQILARKTDQEIRDGIQQRALSAHPISTVTIDVSSTQCIGPANAPITVVEYADFECPHCRVISPILHQLVGQMNPNVRLCFKHFPVRGHSHAVDASIAAIAAGRQGRFWQMHNALYASSPDLDDGDLLAAARSAGVGDIGRWQRDLRDRSIRQQVQSDKLEGIRLGVRGTPTIFVNGKQYLGQKNNSEIRDRLEEELDLVRGNP